MGVYWVTGGILAAYLILVWFLGTWLHLNGADLWILRGGLAFIGLIAAGVFLWFYHKAKKAQADAEGQSAAGTSDIDLLVREAVRRLKSSTLGRGTSIRSLPVVFLLGEPGSTKTTTIVHSALDPELLAGHVYRDNEILPTRVSNAWYTREAVFVDPAGDLMSQSSRWRRLIKLVQPGRMSAAFGKGQQAPRAAIVCYDCGNFLQPGASESTISAARKLAIRLHEISQLLSISFPVYVLFTKLDKVSFFTEFARDLTKEEAAEVLGVTLPVRPTASGVYAEEETRRLTKAFDELFYSLAEKRLELLTRENEGDKLPGIYEFPRELRKLRTLLVQFLVDLARPSHLSVNPFLRGFYFSGVRPVVVDEVVKPTPQVQAAGFDGGATRIFTGDDARSVPQGPARVAGSRKVPQWVFLTQLFNGIIVKDRVALATSGFSTRVSLLRRIALISVAIIGVVCAIGFTISYFGNRELLWEAVAADATQFSTPSGPQVPLVMHLQRLEETGELLDRLETYKQEGAPLGLRWGLYVGDDLYPQVCSVYARGLNQLILGPTRASMAEFLKQLTYRGQNDAGPGDSQAFGNAYNTLKTYLITTDSGLHVNEAPRLVSDLYANWPASQAATQQPRELVTKQFERYARELVAAHRSCFASTADQGAVSNARAFLNNFPPDQRMYQAMLAAAAAKNKDFDFKPFSDDAARDDHHVPARYTKAGWVAMMAAFQNPERYISGEPWVLGEGAQASNDARAYVPKLRERYKSEFINEWVEFLRESRFQGYKGPADIPTKVGEVAGGHSALLMVFCVTAENTGADEVKAAFTDASGLVPLADCDARVVGSMNKPYTDALFALSDCLDKMHSDMPQDHKEIQRKECEDRATAAREVVNQLVAQNQGTNPAANKAVANLLDRPIIDPLVEAMIKQPAPPGAGDVCAALKQLGQDFPNGSTAFDELEKVFKPVSGLLDQHKPATADPNPRYVSFFRRAQEVQQALYPDGVALQLRYAITALPSAGVDNFSMTIGNKTGAQHFNSFNDRKDFVWTGDSQESVVLKVPGIDPAFKTGPLAIFQFVSDVGEPGTLTGSNYSFDVVIKHELGNQVGSKKTLNFVVNAGGASQLFQRGWVGNLDCTAKVAQ